MAWKRYRGPEAMRRMTAAQRRAVSHTAHVVLDASQAEVPLDEGTLSRSGMVFLAPGGLPEAAISYGGGEGTGAPLVPYAIRWHEEEANFQRGRKSGYLRDPFNRLAGPTLMKASRAEAQREGF